MADDITKWKSIRTAYKGHCTRNINEASDIMSSDVPDVEKLEGLLEAVIERFQKITTTNEKILDAIGTDEIADEIEETLGYEDTFMVFRKRATDLLNNAKLTPPTQTSVGNRNESSNGGMNENSNGGMNENSNSGMNDHNIGERYNMFRPRFLQQNVKLPKITPIEFSGNPLEWISFWESFESAVDGNLAINNVDKMNYLRSFLKGDALRVIEGLSLSNHNYAVCVDLLKERFGKKQTIVNAYMDAVMKMPYATNDVKKLRRFYDTLEVYVRGLESLGITSDSYGCLLLPILLKKIPDELKRVILRNCPDPDISEMREQLKQEIDVREKAMMCSEPRSNDGSLNREDRKDIGMSPASTLLVQSNPEVRKCVFCGSDHAPDRCLSVSDVEKRVSTLKKQGRCFNCFRRNHMLRACLSKARCSKCGGKHHVSICRKENKNEVDHNAMKDPDKKEEKENKTSNLFSGISTSAKRNVILQSACVWIKSNYNQIKSRILFDTGAQRTFITKRLANKLKCYPVCTEVISVSSFGSTDSKMSQYDLVAVELVSLLSSQEKFDVDALVVNSITLPIPMKVPPDWLQQPAFRGLNLADKFDEDILEVDMIIGNDYYGSLVTGNMITKNGVMAMESSFGWLISGPIKEFDTLNMYQISCYSIAAREISNKDLDARLKTFWEVSSSELDDKSYDEVMENFQNTIKFDTAEGRYMVNLPWKFNEKVKQLPVNLAMCRSRLKSLVRRLRKIGRLKEYDGMLKDQTSKMFIEDVPKSHVTATIHYLPHFAVFRDDSETTKLRIVYDPSTKMNADAPCLNDFLEKGPSLLPLMTSLLIKFRLYDVAMIADIEKAFLQILLDNCDRDVTRFLWLHDINGEICDDNIRHMRFRRVLFGPSSSPFLMNATIRYHLNTYKNDWVVDKLINSLYSDNLVSGVKTKEEGTYFHEHSRHIFKEAGMNLRGWNSNSAELRKIFMADESDAKIKVLGLMWDVRDDTLELSTQKIDMDVQRLSRLTKRNVCGIAARMFDPLGFLEPFTVRAKMMMQQLWIMKVRWDDPIPDPQKELWNEWIKEIPEISGLQIDRKYCENRSCERSDTEIHMFCDSSGKAYGAACYIRIKNDDGDVYLKHVVSKSKIVPVKEQTIPRLELMAALLGCTLLQTVTQALETEVNVSRIVCWSDSQIVLYWISGKGSADGFVKRRVDKINELVDTTCWRFFPSKLNPADIITRGATVQELSERRWLDGPLWLLKEEEWPNINIHGKISEDNEIKSVIVQITKPSQGTNSIQNIITIEKFSCLNRLLRVTAYVLRFVHNCFSTQKKSGELDVCEKEVAMTRWIKDIQGQVFFDEIKLLSTTAAAKLSPLMKQFNLFLDDEGVLRCKGRIENALLPVEEKFPVLLPRVHRWTYLVILKAHRDIFHSGVRDTLVSVRQKYWIPHGRRVVKSSIRNCVICRKVDGKPYRCENPPPLPVFRISEGLPFQYIGVDLAGPLFVRWKDQKIMKSYICLFTCAVVRAIHLEIVEDTSVSAFLRAFRRFISRRGIPDQITSDNAKNFKGAAKELLDYSFKIMETSAAQKFLFNKGIKWHFIVARAPWWGGFYERMVGLVKRSLKKSIGRSLIMMKELVTVITEVEAVVNSRPLTYVYTDIEEGTPLTPSHFLCGKRLTAIPEISKGKYDDPDFIPKVDKNAMKKKWKIRNTNMKIFWSCWRKEYLVNLRECDQITKKRNKIEAGPQIGDVVLLGDQIPRSQWKLVQIIDLIRGKDGIVRAASIKMSNGTILTRAIQHLYPLEMHDHIECEMIPKSNDTTPAISRPKRAAALDAEKKILANSN